MDIIDGLKTCRKGLHRYSSEKRTCPECRKISARLWRQNNLEHVRERDRKRYARDPQKRAQKWRRWFEKNQEKHRENSRNWNKNNHQKHRERGCLWAKNNPERARARNAKRRAAKRQATAPWADHEAIKNIYAEALRLEKETGISHDVDHIYPLQSEYMCGLHVETNLQILTEEENARKGNRTWPGQLECQKDPNPLFMRVE